MLAILDVGEQKGGGESGHGQADRLTLVTYAYYACRRARVNAAGRGRGRGRREHLVRNRAGFIWHSLGRLRLGEGERERERERTRRGEAIKSAQIRYNTTLIGRDSRGGAGLLALSLSLSLSLSLFLSAAITSTSRIG